MDRGCRQRSKTEYLEADDGISSKALVGGGTHHEVPCPHGCRQSLRRKEFASPLGVRVCESLHEKQDRK